MSITTSNPFGVTKELLDYLGTIYPDCVPSPSMTDREIWMDVGKQVVIRKLWQIYKWENTAPSLGDST